MGSRDHSHSTSYCVFLCWTDFFGVHCARPLTRGREVLSFRRFKAYIEWIISVPKPYRFWPTARSALLDSFCQIISQMPGALGDSVGKLIGWSETHRYRWCTFWVSFRLFLILLFQKLSVALLKRSVDSLSTRGLLVKFRRHLAYRAFRVQGSVLTFFTPAKTAFPPFMTVAAYWRSVKKH